MRHIRPLFLLAILFLLGGVGMTYYLRLKQRALNAPAKPVPLPVGTTGTSHKWKYTHISNEKTVVTVEADDLQEVDGKQFLTGVSLDILDKDSKEYNHVTSAKADADLNAGMLYSDGEVEITMKVPLNEPPPASGKLMSIKSSGVHVEIKTGKANTDRPVTFKFDRGDGKAVGANYDPTTRVLELQSQSEMYWRGTDPKTVPMKIEADHVSYAEKDGKVLLLPWSRLTRDTLTLNAGPAVVLLDHGGLIKEVDTENAHGTDVRPQRNLAYEAQHLTINFNDENQISKITGVDQAKLVSTGDTSVTTMTADRVEMEFDTETTDSILKSALATGHSIVESKPVLKPGVDPSDTRILKSDQILTKMRPGGQDIESVETSGPGAIEFIPNRPDQPHRWMNGARIAMTYGPKNQLQSFRSNAVSTKTVKPRAKDVKEDPPPEFTWSKDLYATFQPNSTQIDKLEQTTDFRYEAGERKAHADRAMLDQPNDRIFLTGKAHISDNTGVTDADKITLEQKTGDFTAEGNVNSTRLPDQTKKDSDDDSGGGMLDDKEPLHARAKKMSSSDNHLKISYEGNAVLWQGANRLEAEVVEIDRDHNLLKAHGHVVSQLLDKDKNADDSSDAKPKEAKASPKAKDSKPAATAPAPRVFTIVKAPELYYDDDKREAEYKGGAVLQREDMLLKDGVLQRQDMQVKAKVIHAFLRNDSDDSSLDHAFADGDVRIHQTSPGRIRDGSSEHAEYYVDDDKVILTEGRPKFADTLRGNTEGEKLTWFSKDDRLLVNGVEARPVKSVLLRKK